MNSTSPTVALQQALGRAGVRLEDLRRDAEAIALFGSRAAGCATPDSDWDLFCIGTGRSQRLRGIDLVWVEPRTLDTPTWLGGDLAGHVAAHGLWLEGLRGWDLGDVDFPTAARRKEARLTRQVRAIAETWRLLGAAYRLKHATSLRRDVQRCHLLQQAVPIPPSAVLDDDWIRDSDRAWFSERLLSHRAPPDLARELLYAAEPSHHLSR